MSERGMEIGAYGLTGCRDGVCFESVVKLGLVVSRDVVDLRW